MVLTKAPPPRRAGRGGSATAWTIWRSRCPTAPHSRPGPRHLTEVGIDHAGVVLEGGHPSLQLRDPDGIAIELVAP